MKNEIEKELEILKSYFNLYEINNNNIREKWNI